MLKEIKYNLLNNTMKAKVIVVSIVLIVVSSCASSRTTNCDAYGDNTVIHNTDTDVTI
jgi:hypothetical protein